MSLFPQDPSLNLLPYDGMVQYFGPVISNSEASEYFLDLESNIPWENDEAIIFGKHIITKRMVSWYGDENFSYQYSGTTKKALLWNQTLLKLKKIVEQISNDSFNSCLLNLYHDGSEGMSWHSDNEASLGKNTTIASVSFGAERRFCFRHKQSKKNVELLLENGSLLLMKGETQTNWLHSLPKSAKIRSPRINLTFRKYQV
ncbi:MAG: alpha-ketoglutarate-dependent dioxygenase AlkB [Leptospira sp.]|nr:alpha-ketoglutarate-dependent dioxygenase AlkB [Leptospira sp.]